MTGVSHLVYSYKTSLLVIASFCLPHVLLFFKTMPDDVQGAVSTIYTSSEQLRLFAFEAEVNENFEMAAVYYEEVIKHLSSCCCLLSFVQNGYNK